MLGTCRVIKHHSISYITVPFATAIISHCLFFIFHKDRTGQKTMHGFIMAFIDKGQNSLSHWEARIWLPKAFKFPGTPTKTHWSWAQVTEKSACSLQNYTCFSPLTSGLESSPTNLLPLTGPRLRPTVQKHGWGLECQKVNFPEYLCQETLGCHSLSSLLFRSFSSPTNIHTHSS